MSQAANTFSPAFQPPSPHRMGKGIEGEGTEAGRPTENSPPTRGRLNPLCDFVGGAPLTPALSPSEGERGKPPLLLVALQLPAPSKTAKRSHFLFATCFIATAALAIVLFRFDPTQHEFYPRCFFHQATGLQCPGCGALRAGHQLLHGHILAALHLNALLVGSLPVIAVLVARRSLRRRNGGSPGMALRTAWIWMVLCVLLGFTVLRNFPAFAFLSP